MCYETYGTRFKWMTLLFHIVTSVGDGIWKQKEIYKKRRKQRRGRHHFTEFSLACATLLLKQPTVQLNGASKHKQKKKRCNGVNAVSPLSFVKSTAPGNPYPGAAFQDSHTFRNRLKTGNVFPFPRIVNLKQYSVRQILLWKIPGGTSSLPTQYQQWRQCSHAPWAHKYKCLCRHSWDLKNNATPQSKGTTRLQKPWLLKLAAILTWGLSGECRSETKHAKPWAFALEFQSRGCSWF